MHLLKKYIKVRISENICVLYNKVIFYFVSNSKCILKQKRKAKL